MTEDKTSGGSLAGRVPAAAGKGLLTLGSVTSVLARAHTVLADALVPPGTPGGRT